MLENITRAKITGLGLAVVAMASLSLQINPISAEASTGTASIGLGAGINIDMIEQGHDFSFMVQMAQFEEDSLSEGLQQDGLFVTNFVAFGNGSALAEGIISN